MILLLLFVQPVQSICHLETARRLAVLVDGTVQLLDQETFEQHALPGIKVGGWVNLSGGT